MLTPVACEGELGEAITLKICNNCRLSAPEIKPGITLSPGRYWGVFCEEYLYVCRLQVLVKCTVTKHFVLLHVHEYDCACLRHADLCDA